MLEPYKMVLGNIVISFLLLILSLFYRYIYPRRRINLLVLTALISLLPIVSILRIGDYESGDFNTHVYRSMSFYNALLDGQLMPSWAKELNAAYGYPLFIFLNPLLYYFVSLFHFLGFTFISSMKILLAISFVFSGAFMYLFAKAIFKNNLASFVASVFYLFAPYHLLDLHFRVAVGETVFFALLPLFMLLIYKLINDYSFKHVLAAGLITGLLFLTHQAMALFSVIIGGLYLLFLVFRNKTKKPKRLIFAAVSLLIGFIISMYTWLPHLIYPKYTYAYLLSSKTVSFPSFWELFFSPYRLGFLFQGPKGEHTYLIGYTQVFIILATLILILKEKTIGKIKIHQLFWFFCFSVFFFMLTPFSKFIWETLPILNTTQFATRLLLPLTFIIAILAGYFALYYKNKSLIINFLVILTIGYTILNWGHRRLIPQITDATLKNNLPKATIEGEAFCCMASPRWVDIKNPWMENAPLETIEIVKGEGDVTSLFKNSVRHKYVISANTPLFIKENTLYFPGWRVWANGQEMPIDYKNPSYRGIIHFSIPKGLNYVKVEYRDLSLHSFSKNIAVIGFILISFYLVFFTAKKLYGPKNNFLIKIVKCFSDRLLDSPYLFNFIRYLLAGKQLGMKKFIHTYLKKYQCQTIADLCCGTGDFAQACPDDSYYFGWDANPDFINFSKKRYQNNPKKKFIRGDILNSPELHQRRFDAVLFISSLHHFSNSELSVLLPKIRRITKKVFIVADIIPNPPHLIQKFFIPLDRGLYIRPKEEKLLILKKHFEIVKTELIPTRSAVQFGIVCKPKTA